MTIERDFNINDIYQNSLLQNCPHSPEIMASALVFARDVFKVACRQHGVDYRRLVRFIATKLHVSCHDNDSSDTIEKLIIIKLFNKDRNYSF